MQDIQPIILNLSNGLRVVYLYAPARVAHIGVTILAGSRFEKPQEEGLAHFLEHCIFKGTKNRKAFHILSRLDAVGGEINAYTAKEEMCVYASFSKEYINRAIELLADIILNSTFPKKEIDKEKEIIIDELNSYLDNPSEKIYDDFENELFRGHALGNNILGTKESVKAFSKANLESYVERFFTAEKTVISFVGDIPLKKILAKLENYFGQMKNGSKNIKLDQFSKHKPFKIRSKEANYQVHALLGGFAPDYKNDHRKGMTLLTNILGGPALNSRLTLTIREKYGYSYNVEASYTPYLDTGYWSVYFGTDAKYLDKTLSLVYKELYNLRNNKMGVLQLNRAKDQLKGHLALSMDSNSGLMLGLGKSLLLFDQIDTMAQIYEGIDNLTSSELLDIANHYLLEENTSELIFETNE